MTAPSDVALDEDTLVGRVVEGRFHVLERLAAGGMGVVYKAEQQPLGRLVALKILELQNGAIDESFSQRFFLEASAAAKLAHPNTIVVHDYGKTSDDLYFIAMEYLDGGTLSARLKKQGPLLPPEAIHVAMQIASSLRDAHQQGLVHRDLKPGNVMFTPRGGDPLFIKVLDFGLVKMVGEGQNLNLTQSGVMMGSPRYMSPEQVKSQAVDARTDIYSFGAVLFHAITGRPPFVSGSAFEAMNHHVYTAAPSLHDAWAHCPAGPQLDAVVRKCLEKDPANRFQTMDDVMGALRACAGEAGASASVGSYLGVGSTSSADAPAPTAPPVAAPPMAAPQPAPTPAPVQGPPPSQKTLLYQPAPSFPAPQPVPQAAPAPSSGGMLWKVLLGAFVLLFAGVAAGAAAWLLIPVDEVEPTPEPPTPEPVAVEPAPEPEPEPEPAPVPEPAPATAEAAPSPLMLRTDPPGATVRRDGADLGDTPIPLLIATGERWTVEISHEGYETRTVTLLGGQPELTVHLDAADARPRPRTGRRRAPVPQPQVRPLGGGRGGPARPDPRAPELDNPWAN